MAVTVSLAAPEMIRIPGARRPYLLGRTPVTNAEYAVFLATGRVAPPPWWLDAAFSAAAKPVVGVNWDEATAYCAWISESLGGRWRLPTQIEWEHAACGGLVAPATAWGDTVPDGEIPAGALDGPWDAGRGMPNGYGLCDMGTIVHEWCLDWDRPGRRASRGGSWRHAVRWSSPAAKSSLIPFSRYADYGFRVAKESDSESEIRDTCEEPML